MLNDSMACSNSTYPPPRNGLSQNCVRASWPHLRGLTCLSHRRQWRQQFFPVAIRIGAIYRPVHFPPGKGLGWQRARLRDMRRFLNWRTNVHPVPGVLRFQNTGLRSCMSTIPPSQSWGTMTNPTSTVCRVYGRKFVSPAMKIGAPSFRRIYQGCFLPFSTIHSSQPPPGTITLLSRSMCRK